MSYTINDIVDAIANDLAPIISSQMVEDYVDWRYAPPDTLTPEQAPWLAVFSEDTQMTLLTTVGDINYQADHEVTIEWAVSIGQSAENGGAQNPEIAKKAIVAADAIFEQLKTYAGGLPTPFTNQTLGTLSRIQRTTSQALVFAQRWTLTVNDLGAE